MHKTQIHYTSGSEPLLELSNIDIRTPGNRMLFRDLNLVLERERVAVIGRNGVGKSTLFNVMAGNSLPTSGEVRHRSKPYLVPQQVASLHSNCIQLLQSLLPGPILAKELKDVGLASLSELTDSTYLSYGEIRKLHLLVAKIRSPDMLLLDEPTEDLDGRGVEWLLRWLLSWRNGLLVVSHDRVLLSHFKQFIVVTESGCSSFSGTFSELGQKMESEAEEAERSYIQKLHMLAKQEEHNAKVLRRRQRKKNFGRISELERCTSRQRLNKKRGKAQVSQGKAAKTSRKKIDTTRDWARSGRRALTVSMPLELPVPQLDTSGSRDLVRLEAVMAKVDQRVLFKDVDLSLGYERFAVVGPNGAGKTTLLNIILGKMKPFSGKATTFASRIRAIAQGGANWLTEESLLSLLMLHSSLQTLDEIARLLLTHKFPLALAGRPLRSLSPGERVRAALICLFHQTPEVQVLVLDEPTYSLDFVGETSLRAALKAWPGALIVVSHHREFLASIGISRWLELDGSGGHSLLCS